MNRLVHQSKLVLLTLALSVGGLLTATATPAAHAASPPFGCLPACVRLPLPTLTEVSSQPNGDGTLAVTLTGQNYTPGGQVTIALTIQQSGFCALFGTCTSYYPAGVTTASTPFTVCNRFTHLCYATPGGTIDVTVTLPGLVDGVPTCQVLGTVQTFSATDMQTSLTSNAAQCF
jgi:hypothetical protein